MQNDPLSSGAARPEEPAGPSWLELRVTTPLDASDAVSGFLWELGAEGITEEPSARAGEAWALLRAYVPSREADALTAQVRAYLQELEEIFPGAAQGRIGARLVEQQDWNAAWKEHFKPLKVSPRLVIRPSWEPYAPAPGEVVLDIDPGMAFGTGTHETTRGCLKAIDALFGGGGLPVVPLAGPVTVLDVGTGSGILLIAALKLGATRGEGVDLDPLAVTAAGENCASNGLQEQATISDRRLETLEGTHRLVLANILAPVLIDLATHLIARLEPSGALVLSGLLTEQAAAVREAFEPRGMRLETSLREGEWETLILRRSDI